MLTEPKGARIWVNLARYDKIFRTTNEDDEEVTRLLSTLSDTDCDYVAVDVMEKPEEFVPHSHARSE